MWFTGDVSLWWPQWLFEGFWAPAVTLLIPHSLYLFSAPSWPLSLLFFFYFIAFCMSLSHSICPFSHSCHCLSFTAFWTQTCMIFYCGTQKEMFSTMFMLIFYIQYSERRQWYFVIQKHHNSSPYDSCSICLIFWSHTTALTDEQTTRCESLNNLIWFQITS